MIKVDAAHNTAPKTNFLSVTALSGCLAVFSPLRTNVKYLKIVYNANGIVISKPLCTLKKEYSA